MGEPLAAPPPRRPAKPAVERLLELWLFRTRWLMAPFYVGLTVALAALLYAFLVKLWHGVSHVAEMSAGEAILMTLSLIDLSLAGNLLLIVIFAGYENFVSKFDSFDSCDRPAWMGSIDFSGMKMKLAGSIVAISAIALLRTFMRLAEGEEISGHTLSWLIGLHLTLVVSGVLLALMDWIAGRGARRRWPPPEASPGPAGR